MNRPDFHDLNQAGLFGLLRVEYVSAQIAWILFVVFIILAVVSFIFGRGAPRSLE